MNCHAKQSKPTLEQSMSRRPTKRRGTVLLIVAIIVMLLSLAAYQFMLTMQTEHLAAAITEIEFRRSRQPIQLAI